MAVKRQLSAMKRRGFFQKEIFCSFLEGSESVADYSLPAVL